MRSAITVSLVDEARGGPFVYWDGLDDACARASGLGFDAIEVFAPSATAVDDEDLRSLLIRHSLSLAAVGTGAGMVKHKLSLTDADAGKRGEAASFVKSIIDWGSRFKAPAIIGSMQGRYGAPGTPGSSPGQVGDRVTAMDHLRRALDELGRYADERGVPLIYEPLNRYETNLCNTVADGVKLVESLDTGNVKLLADLFHMNIEEADIGEALRLGGSHIGHVHFVDSNRRAAGLGHIAYPPIVAALRHVRYAGYLSAEAVPLPDADTAAKATIDKIGELFG